MYSRYRDIENLRSRASTPEVSIVILNWNGLEDTIECLESLRETTYPNCEIIVVDNASSGNDVEVLKERYRDDIHIIENDRNYGFAEGNNIGIRYALTKQSDYILMLNNDTVVDANFLAELVRVAEEDDKAGILGGKIYYYASPNRFQSVGGRINWWLGYIKDMSGQDDVGQFEQVAERDYVYATAMLIKRQVIEKVGLLDSSLFFGMEDYDYCARAKKAGFKVLYVPGARVWHKQGASRKKLPDHPETWRLINKEKGILSYKPKPVFHLFRKHGPPYLFIFPAVNRIIYETIVNSLGMIRGAFYYLRRCDLRFIKKYLKDIFKHMVLRIGALGKKH
jgi:GT2 family glycosyltransferase